MADCDRRPTERFSQRVDNYLRFRPGYPDAVVELQSRHIGLTPDWRIADVGSGTGISAEMFLRHGNTVFGVEPNREMREAAERQLASYERFHSVEGAAEATTLTDNSVDCVVAAQAFHWFAVDAARTEFRRILSPRGWAVLVWNTRRTEGAPFLRAYEDLLLEFGTDYQQVRHDRLGARELSDFYAPAKFQSQLLENSQHLNFEGLRGRLLSSSYVPGPAEPGYEAMLQSLARLFERYAQDGRVWLQYDVQVVFGRLG
jgi:SAM-dependent methyltransferase